MNGSSGDSFRLHQTKIWFAYAEKAAEGLEGPIVIDAVNGVRVDDKATGAGVPAGGIKRIDMRAEEADQACRAALRFGADSQTSRYAAYRAGSEASERAGTNERLPEFKAELEALATEGHFAARTEVALLNYVPCWTGR